MERRRLSYAGLADLIADVRRLRARGYDRAGTWSLEQACWHLDRILRFVMTGQRAPTTPEQDAARPMLERVLATGQIPSGVKAPEPVTPPADAPAAVVDEFIADNEKFNAHRGPFSTHRLFGNVTDQELKRLHLIHCAHHLSHLVPKG